MTARWRIRLARLADPQAIRLGEGLDADGAPAAPVLQPRHLQLAASLELVRPYLPAAAVENAQALTNILRQLCPVTDAEIAVVVLEVLHFASQVYLQGATNGQLAEAWPLLLDALGMAAVDLSEMERTR
jgi:hypothetical protein